MAVSDVSICNQALSWLGESPIIALSDNSRAGRLCKANYEPLRDAVLEDRAWSFASERVILPPSATSPVFEYTHQYQLPSDHIRTLEAREDDRFDEENKLDWAQEGNFILCSVSVLYLKYVRRVTNPTEFSAGFVQTLAARIATDIAIPITRSRTLQADMKKLYDDKLMNAGTNDAMQGRTRPVRANKIRKRRLL